MRPDWMLHMAPQKRYELRSRRKYGDLIPSIEHSANASNERMPRQM